MKRPAAKQACPKPSQLVKDTLQPLRLDFDDELGDVEQPPAPAVNIDPELRKYTKMFYKNGPAWALRQMFGCKKQIFQHKQEAVVDAALDRLRQGECEATVTQWAKAQH